MKSLIHSDQAESLLYLVIQLLFATQNHSTLLELINEFTTKKEVTVSELIIFLNSIKKNFSDHLINEELETNTVFLTYIFRFAMFS